MCGIALTINGSLHEVVKMGNTISRRGKKDGITEIDNLKVYFTWLPITDPTAPMQPFECGELMVWLNGYISNYREIAHKYNIDLKTNCDTELLAKYLHLKESRNLWRELNGFFSFVVYDRIKKEMYCHTDRYGIKQLYKYENNGKTYIASEPKALLSIMEDVRLDDIAVEDWLYSLGVMTDHTIYQGIRRIGRLPFIQPEITDIPYPEAKERLTALFNQSIARNKVKGIPDCVFLSGGVDSGMIARYINPDYCFSMDYRDEGYSEGENIRANSQGIHLSMICNRKLFNAYLPKTFDALDDLKVGSCYTNFALTGLASNYATVIYSGAGGDEVFDGYTHRYNKPIGDVIRRTEFASTLPFIYEGLSHKQYDWKFLQGILVVEDRMAGYHTMETRYPLLDNDFVDFALSLPKEYRENKKILRDICGLDPKVAQGPKHGFSNPYLTNYEWARIALKSIQEKYLTR